MVELLTNGGDPDQTPYSAASVIALHGLPTTLLGVSRLQYQEPIAPDKVPLSFLAKKIYFLKSPWKIMLWGLTEVLLESYNIYFFLISPQNICCGYRLEVPLRGTSNEYHNINFCGEIRKILIRAMRYPQIWRYVSIAITNCIPMSKCFCGEILFFLFPHENICCGTH